MTEIQRLELLDSRRWMQTFYSLSALATEHYVNHQFYGLPEEERKKAYKTNVANNIVYVANNALIESSIVGLVETIRGEDKREALPLTFSDLEELRKHRIVISHPANVKFSDPEVQKFFDDRSQYKDPKAVRIWRTRQQLLDRLTKLGSSREKQFPNSVTVQTGTIESIYTMLNVSLQSGQTPFLMKDLAVSVPTYFQKYEEGIRKFASTLS
jgi:hypothetical protein